MSTRANIVFMQGDEEVAVIYRHNDGYPSGLGRDLLTFLEDVRTNVPDTRFSDASYLAAKWVVWDATRQVEWKRTGAYRADPNTYFLDFLSIGIMNGVAGDAEYIYRVQCNSDFDNISLPRITVLSVWGQQTWESIQEAIVAEEKENE